MHRRPPSPNANPVGASDDITSRQVATSSNSAGVQRMTAAVSKSTKKRPLPDLYRAAVANRWGQVMARATSHPSEAAYVNPDDGCTALHVAIISRVCYSNCPIASGVSASDIFGSCDSPAPTSAIRALLVAYPDAVTVRCKRNGYTPLAYTCLVPPPGAPSVSSSSSESEARRHRPRHDVDDDTVRHDNSTRALETMKEDPERDGQQTNRPKSKHPDTEDMSKKQKKHKSRMYRAVEGRQNATDQAAAALGEAEEVVRLILEYRRDSASILTRSGLSPLDVHIVSYSQSRGHDEEAEGIGRTTTGVLRALLETDPSLARSRPLTPTKEGLNDSSPGESSTGGGSTDSGGVPMSIGPLELLYRCNSQAFMAAVAREDEKHPKRKKKHWYEGYESAPEKSSTLTVTLGTWWVWKWTILLLKYGTLNKKKRGARFKAVHAAASVRGCPLPLFMLTVRAFPSQIREKDEMTGGGNLPLHIVASWGRGTDSSRKGMALSALLSEYPEAAKIENDAGKTPLWLALETGTTWEHGVRRLVKACPEAVGTQRRENGDRLFPFIVAAVAACKRRDAALRSGGTAGRKMTLSESEEQERLARRAERKQTKRELMHIWTVFELLRLDPKVLAHCLEEQDGDWAQFDQVVGIDTPAENWADFTI